MAHGTLWFHTPSWTDPAHEGYEIEVDLAERRVHCSCMDATCRKKNWKEIGKPGKCKHAQYWEDIVWPVIERALGPGRLDPMW